MCKVPPQTNIATELEQSYTGAPKRVQKCGLVGEDENRFDTGNLFSHVFFVSVSFTRENVQLLFNGKPLMSNSGMSVVFVGCSSVTD